MKPPKTSFFQYSECAILMQWDPGTQQVLSWRMAMEQAVKSSMAPLPIMNHGSNAILFYWEDQIPVDSFIARLKQMYEHLQDPKHLSTRIWELPVWYQKDHADFKVLQEHTQLDSEQLIELHSSSTYQVDFLGFLPGFPYLKGLNASLHIERKRTPSRAVAPGTVAIAHTYCGIYPRKSPGGWYVLGQCPLGLFDPRINPPTIFQAGDKIKFIPIEKGAFHQTYQKDDLQEVTQKYLQYG